MIKIGLIFLSFSLNSLSCFAEDDFSRKGADTCLKCHDEESDFPILSIFKTKHGSRFDPSSPFANAQCETCHGGGNDHARSQKKGKDDNPMRTFGHGAQSPVTEQNQVCLGCHQKHGKLGWFGSTHEQEDVACANCHQIHAEHDRVLSSESQQKACFSCHPRIRNQTLQASSHPLKFGKMSCTDCHNPHDSNNDSLLKHGTVNDTCYSCHAERRGPFLWEHAPVTEDCTLCHNPHGSNHKSLLKMRPPLLCQRCHSPAGHPSTAYTSDNSNENFQSRFVLARSCSNCHDNIHGSNHPSGANLTR